MANFDGRSWLYAEGEVPLIEDAVQRAYISAKEDNTCATYSVGGDRRQYAVQVLEHFWIQYSRNCSVALQSVRTSHEDEVNEILRSDLPISGIKQIMRSNQEVEMVSDEAPMLLAQAVECFSLDMLIRARDKAVTENGGNEDTALVQTDHLDSVTDDVVYFDFLRESSI
eukprot:gb/GECG01008257.1/.p1 GENE.gb/GECG01008257.1/~~gb/GECG01008257.1/.p1  ORF type:complete len:169 (+),score=20.41 gb/GECG01008257.1/:1-507(+)